MNVKYAEIVYNVYGHLPLGHLHATHQHKPQLFQTQLHVFDICPPVEISALMVRFKTLYTQMWIISWKKK
jgi:hypothetical protein